jgi:hypothetical protein
MMGGAFSPGNACRKVALETVACTPQLDGLIIVMFGVNPKGILNLCIWGEAGVVTVGTDGTTSDKGMTMMFV